VAGADAGREVEQLRDHWDALVTGGASAPGDLDPNLAETVRRLHALYQPPAPDPAFVGKLEEELMASTHAAGSPPPVLASPAWTTPNGRILASPRLWRSRPGAGPRLPGILAQLATAVLVLLLAGAYVVFGPLRSDDRGEHLVAVIATPTAPATDVLVDTTVPGMPGGYTQVILDHWTFASGPSTLTLPDHEGPRIVIGEVGTLVATIDGAEQAVEPGQFLIVPTGEHTLRNPEADEARAYILSFTHRASNWPADSGVTWVPPIEGATGAIPAGPARVVLERVVVPAGERLPAYPASTLEWVGAGEGELGVTLVGEGRSQWQSGTERIVRSVMLGTGPQLTPGWQVTLRNPGTEPIPALRLVITPLATATPSASPPAS
jgi:hypothetical protein